MFECTYTFTIDKEWYWYDFNLNCLDIDTKGKILAIGLTHCVEVWNLEKEQIVKKFDLPGDKYGHCYALFHPEMILLL